jgi:phosphoribosylaminoimidazole (AIR) synthetase
MGVGMIVIVPAGEAAAAVSAGGAGAVVVGEVVVGEGVELV